METEYLLSACLYTAAFAVGWLAADIYSRFDRR